MTILMLQTFAGQRRPPGRAANQKTLRLHISGSPDEITDTLKTKHRVIDKKWN